MAEEREEVGPGVDRNPMGKLLYASISKSPIEPVNCREEGKNFVAVEEIRSYLRAKKSEDEIWMDLIVPIEGKEINNGWGQLV